MISALKNLVKAHGDKKITVIVFGQFQEFWGIDIFGDHIINAVLFSIFFQLIVGGVKPRGNKADFNKNHWQLFFQRPNVTTVHLQNILF